MQLKPCPTGNSILDIFASLKKLLYGVYSEACNQFSLVKYTHSLPTTAFSLKEMKMWWRYFIHFFCSDTSKASLRKCQVVSISKKVWRFLKGMLVVSWGEKKIRWFFSFAVFCKLHASIPPIFISLPFFHPNDILDVHISKYGLATYYFRCSSPV